MSGLQFLGILEFLGHPDTSVVTKRFGHQGQFGLEIAVLGDTGRVDLCEAGVSKICSVAVHLHSSRAVGSHCVGGEEEGVAVAAGTNHHCVSEETLDASGYEVAGDDTTCTRFTILVFDHDDVEHLIAGVHLHFAFADLAAQSGVSAE